MALPSFGQPIARIDIASLAGSVALSVTGTANEITVSPNVGNVVVSLPDEIIHAYNGANQALSIIAGSGSGSTPSGTQNNGTPLLIQDYNPGNYSIIIRRYATTIAGASRGAIGMDWYNPNSPTDARIGFILTSNQMLDRASGTYARFEIDDLGLIQWGQRGALQNIGIMGDISGTLKVFTADATTPAHTQVLVLHNDFTGTNTSRTTTLGSTMQYSTFATWSGGLRSGKDTNAVHRVEVSGAHYWGVGGSHATNGVADTGLARGATGGLLLTMTATAGQLMAGLTGGDAWAPGGIVGGGPGVHFAIVPAAYLLVTTEQNFLLVGTNAVSTASATLTFSGASAPTNQRFSYFKQPVLSSDGTNKTISVTSTVDIDSPTYSAASVRSLMTNVLRLGSSATLNTPNGTTNYNVLNMPAHTLTLVANTSALTGVPSFAGINLGAMTITSGSAFTLSSVASAFISAPSVGGSVKITELNVVRVGSDNSQASAAAFLYRGLRVADHTLTLTGSTPVTGTPGVAGVSIGTITVSNATAGIVVNAAALYIAAAPVAAGGGSITNAYALWVDAGVSRFDGNVGFGAALYPATVVTAIGAQTACALYAGTGAPTDALGVDGDYYFRADGGVLTRIYLRITGVWTGIV